MFPFLSKVKYISNIVEACQESSSVSEGFVSFASRCLQDIVDTVIEQPENVSETELHQNLEDTIGWFKSISSDGVLPDDFSQVLLDKLISNGQLREIFSKAGALLYWDESGCAFKQAWEYKTVAIACERLVAWQVEQQKVESQSTTKDLNLSKFTRRLSQLDENMTVLCEFSQDSIGMQLLGENASQIFPAEHLQLKNLLAAPTPIEHFENGYLAEILPFVLLRMKMWDLQILNPENLSRFIKQVSKPKGVEVGKPKKMNFGRTRTNANSTSIRDASKKPITKMDVFASLFYCLHPLIFQEILKLNCQFSLALPFVLRDIRQTNKPRYICVASLLETCNVKWEYIPGKVRYNELFINPFKMIACVRVGSPAPKQPGKSSILNQVLASRYMFSSFSNPGSQHGKPLTLDGSVEFCALTQETASPMLWQSAVQQHYATGTEQVLLLANVHGDCLQFPEILALLKAFASKFIIFLNTMEKKVMEEKYAEVESIFDGEWSEHVNYIVVDPTSECEQLMPEQVVYTANLVSDSTCQIIRNTFRDAIQGSNFGVGNEETVTMAKLNIYESIHFVPEIATQESQDLIDLIENLGCQNTKAALKLQKLDSKTNTYIKSTEKIWHDNPILQAIVTKFYAILQLPLKRRLIAMSHLDKSLSLITAKASVQVREMIMELRAERIRCMSITESEESKELQQLVKVQLETAMEELDRTCLGLEHLLREAGRVFDISQPFQTLAGLPANMGDLLVHGADIEVLDGEMLEMSSSWFNSICHSICRNYGENLRIFVVSIIGLQSSGKSTLLNALFACKFSVSVGRCTRGLFMRILFLEKSLADELGVDAIVVLDTEGLGAPEKLMDENCEQKDRLLATFTMSVSNLTLINVLGESIRDLSDILQIVIVTLARLEEANISPDICMVQHLSERDSSKIMRGETEFANALQEAVLLTEKKDMNMGIRNSKSLQLLEQRIKKGDLAKLFPPFKNGATINAPPSEKYQEAVTELYQMILDAIKASKSSQTFQSWHEIIHSYWDAVSKQDYALRFKNIVEIQNFLEIESKISLVKSAIDITFLKHRQKFQQDFITKFKDLLTSKRNITEWENAKMDFLTRINEELKKVPYGCQNACEKCAEAREQAEKLQKAAEGKPFEQETQATIRKYVETSRHFVNRCMVQMADAFMVLHLKSSDIDNTIAKTFQKNMNFRSVYAKGKKAEKISQIWKRVCQFVSTKLRVEPALRRILREISETYKSNPSVECKVEKMELPNLRTEPAIRDQFYDEACLEMNMATKLLNSLSQITKMTLANYTDKYFENGMIRQIQIRIEEILKNFEENVLKKSLLPEFKWKVRVYGLIQFTKQMVINDYDWNEQYNPLQNLIRMEDEYKEKIKSFLENVSGFQSEGGLVGGKLLTAIRQLAQKKGDEKHVKFFADESWLASRESIRFRYFEELAKQVESGNKELALAHFRNPKMMITNWLKNQVDQVPEDQGIRECKSTVDSEFEQTRRDIEKTQTAEQLRGFVQNYLALVDGVPYNPQSHLNFANATDPEFELFKNAVFKRLDEGRGNLKQGDLTIAKPSENQKILKIFGCNEHCSWCGALCWGEFEHEKNTDDTRKHHACHQTIGLTGYRHKGHLTLATDSCDRMSDECTVQWSSCPHGITWGAAKRHQDFNGWIFSGHSQTAFSELMIWFFVKLNEDITAENGVESEHVPVPLHEQQKQLCIRSDLPSILLDIKRRLGLNH